jgi:mRNA interferase RelE/StbE
MSWTVQIDDYAGDQLQKLDKPVRVRILNYLDDRIQDCKNPRHFGEPLKLNKAGLWRYRVGDYRIICEIQDENLVVLALAVGHRKKIYI